MKTYYAQASVAVPGNANVSQVAPLDFEYEIQAMFPTLASIQAIGDGGVVNLQANTLLVKSSVSFNIKKGAASNNASNQIYSMAELPTVPEKLEMFT
jgi:hypothetical protein